MKKQYIAPELQATVIELQSMIAGSVLTSDSTPDELDFSEKDATSDGLSRRGGLWDDEDW